jgi:hypothetical protein
MELWRVIYFSKKEISFVNTIFRKLSEFRQATIVA